MPSPHERRTKVRDSIRDAAVEAPGRDNEGFIGFQVMDAGVPGELVMIDTWRRREDSERASARPAATGVHERYRALEIAVTSVTRYEVVVSSN